MHDVPDEPQVSQAESLSAARREIHLLRQQIAALKAEARQQSEAHMQTLGEMKMLTGALAQARDQALQMARLKSAFLANMSHEIRTPLNGVIGVTKLMLRTSLDPTQHDYANIIHDSANVLLDLINDILDFSKIESGKLTLEEVDFDVSAAVDSSAQLVAAQARGKQLSFMTFVSPDIPRAVHGDEGHIKQVLLNLLSNAIKFTPKGEIIVAVTPESVDDKFITLRFSVTDTGIGFPMTALESLFRPFEQADGSITRKFGGTGLGLSICRGLVELMGGKIGAESSEGNGSTFWFTINVGKTARVEAGRLSAPVNGMRMILAGMPRGAARVIQSYACAWKVSSVYFPDLETVANCLSEDEINNYDVILVDSSVIHVSGTGVLAGLPDKIAGCLPRMILLSGSPDPGEGGVAVKAGFWACLPKPVPQDQLLSALRDSCVNSGGKAGKLNETVTQPIPLLNTKSDLILVAEDSPTNRKVVALQLASLGYTAQAVANGREALEAVESGAFALVLMDCQMPEMDGFQSTMAIRKGEMRTGHHIPIIALTAHAMPGDRERCLAAGMDDYVSKPVDVDQLKKVLSRWLDPAGQAQAQVAGVNSGQAHVDSAEDSELQTVVEEPLDLAMLERSCGREVAHEILEVFLSAAETLMEGIEAARLKRDGLAIESLAHQLAGSSRAVGAVQITRLCTCMEDAGAHRNWEAARNVYVSLRWAFSCLRSFLSSSLHKPFCTNQS